MSHKHNWMVTYSKETRLVAFCTNREPQDTFEVQITVDSGAAETHRSFFDWLMNEAEKEKEHCEDCLLHDEITEKMGGKEALILNFRDGYKGHKWGVSFDEGKTVLFAQDIEKVLNES